MTPLTPCFARRPFGAAPDVFLCLHPKVHARGNRVTAESCKICRHWSEPPPEQLRDPDAVPRDPAPSPCVYLGAEIGRRTCSTCRGRVQLKVFACHHPAYAATTVSGCACCASYLPRLTQPPQSNNRAPERANERENDG